jgi:hypothetical protein
MNREVLMTVCAWVIGISIACLSTWLGLAIVAGQNTGIPPLLWWVIGIAASLLLIAALLPSKRKSELLAGCVTMAPAGGQAFRNRSHRSLDVRREQRGCAGPQQNRRRMAGGRNGAALLRVTE